MHQRPRPAPRTASAANNPATNPERTDNQRDSQHHRARSSVDLTAYTERGGGGGGNTTAGESSRSAERAGDMASQEREQTKLNQIIQNFHTKAALTICSSRANLPQAYNKNGDLKQNRWFNLVLDDTDALTDDVQEWRRPDLADNRPLPLVIEVFVDTRNLQPGQALVINDESGKRWDVTDVIDANSHHSGAGAGVHEVLLERWSIRLGNAEGYTSSQLNDQLPNVYKKGVVLFRSLYSFSRFMPAWKLHRRLSRQTHNNSLRLRFRIRKGHQSHGLSRSSRESPFLPSSPSDSRTIGFTGGHTLEPLLCPAGPLSVSVQYRLNCNLSVADSESLLSSRFAGLDAGLGDRAAGGRSLPGDRSQTSDIAYGSAGQDRRRESAKAARVAGGGAYGSLGTFHTAGKRESPVTVLRQRALSQEEDESDGTSSRPRPVRQASSGKQSGDYDLLKNPPFKAGSYAFSPRTGPSPSSSAPRASPIGSSLPKRLSLNTLPQQALRAPGAGAEHAIASSGSSSPKPAPLHRYSSSFANRKRFPSQSSKAGESNLSSGPDSSSSKEKSGQLQEAATGSSTSARTDEDDIAAFISTVERAKDLKSFSTQRSSAAVTVNLAKFKGLGIASSELADEMSSSSLIQTSVTPPSRRLSNVPALSTSSSPSRALTHIPHVRSRLSTHSIAEEKEGSEKDSKTAEEEADNEEDEDDDTDDEPFIFQQDNIL